VSPDDFFRNPTTGEVVIAQPPNAPAVLFTTAALLDRLRPNPVTRAVALTSLAWWSVGEIAAGDSPFRRVLGAVGGVAGFVLTRRRALPSAA